MKRLIGMLGDLVRFLLVPGTGFPWRIWLPEGVADALRSVLLPDGFHVLEQQIRQAANFYVGLAQGSPPAEGDGTATQNPVWQAGWTGSHSWGGGDPSWGFGAGFDPMSGHDPTGGFDPSIHGGGFGNV